MLLIPGNSIPNARIPEPYPDKIKRKGAGGISSLRLVSCDLCIYLFGFCCLFINHSS